MMPPAAALLAALLSMTIAVAQTAPPADQPASEPAKSDNPGLINEIGKLFGKPADLFPSFKLTPDTAAPATSPVQPGDTTTPTSPPASTPPAAAPPVVAAPTPQPPPVAAPAPAPAVAAPATPGARIPQMVTGRSSCPFAANGAPDCKTGADLLCKTKGFTSGRSLDMDSSHNCSKEALLAGARSIKDICRTETFVTRAMCQ